MPSMKVIKRRIVSVTSTQQIMKAMNLVAASKLQKAKERLNEVRPLFNEAKRVMDGVKSSIDTADNIFVTRRPVKSIAYIVVTSDRGLCGGYNLDVSKEALAFINAHKDSAAHIISVGAKGLDFFLRRRKPVAHRFADRSDATAYRDAEALVKLITSMYVSGEADEVYVIYTHFASMLSHVPHIVRLLPVGSSANTVDTGKEMLYEPEIDTFLEHAIPMYLKVFLYGAMAEATVCEQAARMMSMDAAANNAEEIIDDLTLVYNRERQAIITQELNEIVGGANALS
ncbi:MAG: ATP synthase F1 subunit gamma [Oscillospiraceae bacterium]|nr:ATP synthase F1 subunit gamma [Oscillospiraceae bacterium]